MALRNAAPLLMRSRGAILTSQLSKHTLPDLPYDFNALEPTISAEIMKVHYQKHHATYVNNLNIAEEKMAEAVQKGCAKTMISLGPAIKFNGGGHINHMIFWTNLAKDGGGEPSGPLMDAIKRDFGSFENMKKELSTKSTGVQGSGWGWLGYNKTNKRLQLATCPNQDPLEQTTGLVPLLGIDVWEHAYYLQYKSARADYVKGIFNIVNWKNVAERYSGAQK
jgi:Fe-Mn family superoxide dismutase